MADGNLLLNHFLDSVNSISALGDASVGGFRIPPETVQVPGGTAPIPTRPPGATLRTGDSADPNSS